MSESSSSRPVAGPLLDLDDWESAHAPGDTADLSTFRDYRENVRAGVREFYRLNHAHQTLAFVLEKAGRVKEAREHLGEHPVATIMMQDMIRRLVGEGGK